MHNYRFLNSDQISSADRDELLLMVENYFDTQHDPEQMQIPPPGTKTSWISARIPECGIVIKLNNAVVGSTLILPCSLTLMQGFVTGRINEAQLSEKIQEKSHPYASMQATYFCSAFIVPEHRGKNLALRALQFSIQNIHAEKLPLFYWQYSQEGKIIAEKLKTHFGVELFARSASAHCVSR